MSRPAMSQTSQQSTSLRESGSCHRLDGYAPLSDYGFLGDGRAGALVARDGDVDWFAAPRLDSAPLCAALLDAADGGSMTLAPAVPYECSHRYLPDTMALERTFRCETGMLRVVDVLNLDTLQSLPWTEMVRRVEPLSGVVPMRWAVRPGHRLGHSRPWAATGNVPVLQVGDVQCAVLTEGVGTPDVEASSVHGWFEAVPGRPGLLAVIVTGAHHPLPLPDLDAVRRRTDHTINAWQHWSSQIDYRGEHTDAVRRSALTLKALTDSCTGGQAAALTTSVPERIGADRNFDYRFGWVRDASFGIDAMIRLNLTQDVHRSLSWLLDAVHHTAPHVRPLYTLDGTPAPADTEPIQAVPGYRGSAPVQRGNSAAGQRQLGAYGDLMDGVWRYVHHGGRLDPACATTVAEITDQVCDLWRAPDAGIWELGDRQHYTISKISCWVALDRALRLHQAGQLPTGAAHRWQTERDTIHRWTDQHCWSDTLHSYTFYAGTDKLDAAVLLAARTHYLNGDDPRLAGTINAIRSHLSAGGPLLYRYSGTAQQEGAFTACSFWLAEALTAAGRRIEAVTVLGDMLRYSGPTAILSEQVDPSSGALLGNLPQGLSHLALIGAAKAVATDQS